MDRRREPTVETTPAGPSKKGKKGGASVGSRGAGPGTTGPERASAEPAPGTTLWGFQPFELLIAASLITLAVVIGLASGGFFR
jgi:hypothetical protein